MSKRRPGKPKISKQEGAGAMGHHLAVDRFETSRDGDPLAVLVTDDGRSIVVPRAFLPAGTEAGATLTMTLALDPEATAEVARATQAIRDDLKKTDPGGTIQL